ncbi:MAG: hypothetical protein R3C99_26505 [Pirellulaceae bacterium]
MSNLFLTMPARATNAIRPTSLTYPDGRTLTYDYGAGDSMPDALRPDRRDRG